MKYCTDLCMVKVHLPPMNKFACKLHVYIVYLALKIRINIGPLSHILGHPTIHSKSVKVRLCE